MAAAASGASHRELDPPLMEVIDQTLQVRQEMELGKRYPTMLFQPEMKAKMMGEGVLQDSMRNAVQPVMMEMLTSGNSQDAQNQWQEVMSRLGKQIGKLQQDAMGQMHAQAPMQNQMREKMVNTFPYTRYLQDIFMARQKPRTIEEFHAGGVVTERMKAKPVPFSSLK